MTLTSNGKIARPIIRNPAFRPAFERLDAALAKNTRSNISEHEKTRLWLLKMFGRSPKIMEIQK